MPRIYGEVNPYPLDDELSPALLDALSVVALIGPCTSSEVERHMEARKSAVYKYLARLRAGDLIVGEKDPESRGHRPAYRFRVSDKGLAVLRAYERRRAEDAEGMLRRLHARQAPGDSPQADLATS